MNLAKTLLENRESTKEFYIELELQLAESRYNETRTVKQLTESLLLDEDASLHIQRLRHEAREIHDRILHREDVDRMSVGELQSIINRLHSLKDDCAHEDSLFDLVRFCVMVIPRLEHEIQKRHAEHR